MSKKGTAKRRAKDVYIIAGPNGAGKTTFAREFLPHYVRCLKFINADYIATGISPFAPEAAAVDAGRLMLKRIQELLEAGVSFGFETTLAGRGYLKMIGQMKRLGYRVQLYFLWLSSSTVAVERVAQRVRKGGHAIPESVIRRRFDSGLKNFLEVYRPLVDQWVLWDASSNPPQRVASCSEGYLRVENKTLYNGFVAGKSKR